MIPEPVLALAAGLNAGAEELGWDEVAAVIKALGLGTYSGDALVREVDVWLMGKGTNRAKVATAARKARQR